MKKIVIAIFLILPFMAIGQFRIVGTGLFTTLNDSTYRALVEFRPDLTGNSYNPTQIRDTMLALSQRGQLYRIDTIFSAELSSAWITLVEKNGDWGSPSGQIMIFETPGRLAAPQTVFAANGATAAMQASVDTWNAKILRQIADSTSIWTEAYNNMVDSVYVTGGIDKTITIVQHDGDTLNAPFSITESDQRLYVASGDTNSAELNLSIQSSFDNNALIIVDSSGATIWDGNFLVGYIEVKNSNQVVFRGSGLVSISETSAATGGEINIDADIPNGYVAYNMLSQSLKDSLSKDSVGIADLMFNGSVSPVILKSTGDSVAFISGDYINFLATDSTLRINHETSMSFVQGESVASIVVDSNGATPWDGLYVVSVIETTPANQVSLTVNGKTVTFQTAADANLSFNGTDSLVSLESSAGTDVFFLQGENVVLSQSGDTLSVGVPLSLGVVQGTLGTPAIVVDNNNAVPWDGTNIVGLFPIATVGITITLNDEEVTFYPIQDGNKNAITVSGNGENWTINNGVIVWNNFSDGVKDSIVSIGDTATMLSTYISVADTAAMLNTYISNADTTTMLSTYISVADTAAMLAPYLKNLVDSILFDTLYTGVATEGELIWDRGLGTINLGMTGGIQMPLGQGEAHVVRNRSGAIIPKGKVVYISGATGQRPEIKLANNTGELSSSVTFGVTAEEIAINDTGFVFTSGYVHGVNTNAFTEGEAIWLDSAGNFTKTKPYAPKHVVLVGYVVTAKNNGTIFVKIQNGFEVRELHNVLDTMKVNKSVLYYDQPSGLYKASTTAGIFEADTATMLNPYLLKRDTATMLLPYLLKRDTATMLNPYMLKRDTATMLNPYLLKRDTLSMLSTYISNADTATMLNTYISNADTATMLSTYISVADTLAMLSTYISNADTATMLSTYISVADTSGMLGTYISVADTATMLNPYLFKRDTATMLNPYLLKRDTATMLNPYLLKRDTLSMLSTYISNADTLGMLSTYISNADTATMLSTYISNADTLAMLSTYISNADTSGMLSTYISNADTATMLTTYISNADTLGMLSTYISNADTAGMLSTYISNADTLGMLSTYISNADTLAMLSTYISNADTSGMLSSYISAADTATMLNPYLLKRDTLSMLSTYISNADTATMLSTYISNADTAAMLSTYISNADTTAMLSPYLRKVDTLSLSNRINGKLDSLAGEVTTFIIRDTAVTTAKIATGAVTGAKLGSMNSAQVAAAVTDETGTDSLVFANSPNFLNFLKINSGNLSGPEIALNNTGSGGATGILSFKYRDSAAFSMQTNITGSDLFIARIRYPISITYPFNILYSNGFVGINTTSPQRQFQVTGEARITDLTTDTPTRIVGADADGDLAEITIGSGLTLSSGTISTSSLNSPIGYDFTTSVTDSTLTIPTNCKRIEIICIGGGGGGGGGGRGDNTALRYGGSGGGGGAYSFVTINAESIKSPLKITTGTGGTGGAGATVDNTTGGDGTAGGFTRVRDSANIVLCYAGGGGGGNGGGTAFGTVGSGGNVGDFLGVSGGNGGGGPGDNSPGKAPSGGGGGGAILNSNIIGGGGAGGNYNYGTTQSNAGVIGGARNGTSGGTPSAGQVTGGGGGGGGVGNTTAVGGNGGAGVRGGGGGGGSASRNTYTSGAGGNGGAGYVRVIFY